MNILVDHINEFNKKEEDKANLFVKNIIVNKDKRKKKILPFIATE